MRSKVTCRGSDPKGRYGEQAGGGVKEQAGRRQVT